ncbi:MAG: ABC transporter substrate-binding protein [Myxococcota bacterium]
MACGGEPPASAPEALTTVLLPRAAEQLDPRFTTDPMGLRVSRLLFASLVTIDPRTLEVVPDLAEEVVAEAPFAWRVRLRSGLRFADGSALDAQDVAATFRGVADPRLGSPWAATYGRIASIEVLGPRELRFVLAEPHATFLTDLELPIVRAEDARRREARIGAGPYRLAGDAGELRLVANAHWHGGTPRHPSLRFVVVRDDNVRAMRLRGGGADLALSAVPPLLVPLFEADPAFEVASAPGVGTYYLGVRTDAPGLDAEARRTLCMALDREALVQAKLGGRGHVAHSWIPAGHWAASEVATPAFEAAAARARVAERPFGRRLVLRTSSDRFRVSTALAIQAMLRDAGVRVDVRPSENASFIADLAAGRFDLALLEVPEVFEPHVLSWFFGSERIPGPGRAGANRWRFRSAALDAALERGRTERHRPARVAAYAEAQAILARELPVIPLFQRDQVAVMRRGLAFDVPRDGRFGTLAR